jgi:hypothetical protein
MPELGTIYDYMRAHAALLGRATRRVEHNEFVKFAKRLCRAESAKDSDRP